MTKRWACSMLSVVLATTAFSQTLKVLYAFQGGTDGANPYASLVHDKAGNLYGTTLNGGSAGLGTVFKIDRMGIETVMHSFTGAPGDGAHPYGALVIDPSGNLYGTTNEGGSDPSNCNCGTVFRISRSGKETVLYNFQGLYDGAYPYAGVIRDAGGNLYGTTVNGGIFTEGTVFKLDKTGQETVLLVFTGGGGEWPYGRLIQDGVGNLYGTTYLSGDVNTAGSVYGIDPSGNFILGHTFLGPPNDGWYPMGGVIRNSAGSLYGTTLSGGSSGNGTIFRLDPPYTETVLYNFMGSPDGSYPEASLTPDPAGNIYGTTYSGGLFGSGTVFKFDTSGIESVLYSFTGDVDGANPVASLIRDSKGNLYGTTLNGGSFGNGVVFKFVPGNR